MARHLLRGELATTLWNQPYNGALDAACSRRACSSDLRTTSFAPTSPLCGCSSCSSSPPRARDRGGVRGVDGGCAGRGRTPYMALMAATGPPPNFLMPLVTSPFPMALRRLPAGRGRRCRPLPPSCRAPAPSVALRCGTRRLRFPLSWAWGPGWSWPGRACPPRVPTRSFPGGGGDRRRAVARGASIGSYELGRHRGESPSPRFARPGCGERGPPRPRTRNERAPGPGGPPGRGRAGGGADCRCSSGAPSSGPLLFPRLGAVARLPLWGWAGALAGPFALSPPDRSR